MALLHCVITTPEGLVFEGDAASLVVPAADGEMGILPRHAPLIGALGRGELRIGSGRAAGPEKSPGGAQRYFLEGGFIQILKNEVSILSTRAEPITPQNQPAAEARLEELEARELPPKASLEEREAHAEDLRAARRRVALGKKGA